MLSFESLLKLISERQGSGLVPPFRVFEPGRTDQAAGHQGERFGRNEPRLTRRARQFRKPSRDGSTLMTTVERRPATFPRRLKAPAFPVRLKVPAALQRSARSRRRRYFHHRRCRRRDRRQTGTRLRQLAESRLPQRPTHRRCPCVDYCWSSVSHWSSPLGSFLQGKPLQQN